ncbi:MAG TPA: ATP-dependent DNA helicase [Candidatus Limiplasma sp.]|nr:ATP-dependent DNA helicase [Candidatus Limiplasma sp.]HPS80585.1 ATP-dependent DNA helicase [Candidatus Limiplasma sp.]
METTFRVSVRELVSFSYFAPDLSPAGGTEEMLAGTQAHQAREHAQAAEFEIEKPIQTQMELLGERVTVFGRMDAFRDGALPCVEEIKLCRTPPTEPFADHLAQARTYGAMLVCNTENPQVEIRVVYVNAEGEPLRVFAERLDRETLLHGLEKLLTPWLAFAVPERERAARRDAGLRAMRFPFEGYRAGQRELAVQVYTAISRKKRLFASLPTGTGKSAAVLFPALKALGEGKTRKIIYLTARTTARQSPINALERIRAQGGALRVSTLTAKEKLCPAPNRCHPDDCPRAKGHFLREGDALRKLLPMDCVWSDEVITAVADEFLLCPFELALRLTELADVVLMDMNYAFDPFAQVIRLFKRRKDFTLLIDEAHHLLDRVRDSLSGALSTKELKAYRTLFGKALGRKHPLYRTLSALIGAMALLKPDAEADPSPLGSEPSPPAAVPGEGQAAVFTAEPSADLPDPEAAAQSAAGVSASPPELLPAREARLGKPPDTVTRLAGELCDTALGLFETRLPTAECRQALSKLIRQLAPFLYAAGHFDNRYAALLECRGRERALELFCLSPAETIAATTKGLRGTVFFSATLSPLQAMRSLLGGDETDACFSLPSPFPVERLAVVRRRVQTRYAYRDQSAARVAESIAEAANARPGKYIAYFPSYAYLRLVLSHLQEHALPPLLIQENEMSEEARVRFMDAFTRETGPKLGLCVLGGLFSEGVDLPGDQLIGAMIVGVGLPTPSQRLKTLQAYYGERFGDGFLYAWMIPAMQKVLQAGGRVIRTERDVGLVLLMDDRYFDPRYMRLLPPEWRLTDEDVRGAVKALRQLEET